MGFQVREAILDDLEEIVELWRKLSRGQLSKDPYYKGSLEFNGGYHQLKQSIESKDCGIFVIEKEGKIEGFIEVWSKTASYQMEHDDCAYIVHCIFDNQTKGKESAIHMIACLYRAAEKWAAASGKKYLTADVFQHNKMVALLLGRADIVPFKMRMVRKI